MDGSLTLQSPCNLPSAPEGVGTCVTFDLPLVVQTPYLTERTMCSIDQNQVLALLVVQNPRLCMELNSMLCTARVSTAVLPVSELAAFPFPGDVPTTLVISNPDLASKLGQECLGRVPASVRVLVIAGGPLGVPQGQGPHYGIRLPVPRQRLLEWVEVCTSQAPVPEQFVLASPPSDEGDNGGDAQSPASSSSAPATGGNVAAAVPRRRVLVAEDTPVLQRLITAQLASLDLDACVCANGVEVLKELEERWYPCILMDYHMPEMDGIACTREIRRREREQDPHTALATAAAPVHIVALTADTTAGARAEFEAAGISDFLSKPVCMPDLRRVLHEVPLFF